MNNIIQPILLILGSIATWYIGKQAVKWVQYYRTLRQKDELTKVREESQKLNQEANSASDILKHIDGRDA